MIELAKSHSKIRDAAKLQLHAAVILSGMSDQESQQNVEKVLLDLVGGYPGGETTNAAKRWVLKIYDAQKRLEDSAKVATKFLDKDSDAEEYKNAFYRWGDLVTNGDADLIESRLREARSSFADALSRNPNLATIHNQHAVLLFDMEQLTDLRSADLQSADGENSFSAFAANVLAFRQGNGGSISTGSVDEKALTLSRWRLLRDGDLMPDRRTQIARELGTWPTSDPWQSARLQLWSGDESAAIAAIRKMLAQSSDPGADQRQAARLLGSHSTPSAKSVAVELWDQLASGVPKGSDKWHEAKLAAISLLRQIGKTDEASRRAKYILLTSPPKDAKLKAKYTSLQ